jgi:hypothetical protein
MDRNERPRSWLRRDLVLLHGGIRSQPFSERGLETAKFQEQDIEKSFRFARALVVSVPLGKYGEITRFFSSVFRQAQQHGLFIAVIVDDKDYKQVTQIKNSDQYSSVRIYHRRNLKRAANDILREYSGPQQESIAKIDFPKEFDSEKVVLLRRAFYDCTQISLEALPEGKGSKGVFRVHVERKRSPVGPRPLPFFAKFLLPDDRNEEWANYRECAELYIPFNLRPNLIRRRCVTGHKLAMLVGNFVEDAVPLRVALRNGQGGKVLFELFETTLRAFRLQPTAAGHGKKKKLVEFVNRRARCAKIEPSIVECAQKLGLTKDPKDLEHRLCELSKDVETWCGPIHGDLHDGNVMVRSGDAILIDMRSIDDGPLTADPATLEVSLVFRTDESDCVEDLDDWRKFVDGIYGSLPLRPPHPDAESSVGRWLLRAVRDMRFVLLGYDCHDTEAAIVIACHLLRFARLPIENCPPHPRELAKSRHAYALVIAQRIIEQL